MSFDAEFLEASKDLLDEFGKLMFYIPRDSGQPRPFLGMKDDSPPGPIPETSNVLAPQEVIECRNTAETYDTDGYGGIDAEFLDTGGDKIRLQVNGEWTELSIRKRLPNQDEAMLKLELG